MLIQRQMVLRRKMVVRFQFQDSCQQLPQYLPRCIFTALYGRIMHSTTLERSDLLLFDACQILSSQDHINIFKILHTPSEYPCLTGLIKQGYHIYFWKLYLTFTFKSNVSCRQVICKWKIRKLKKSMYHNNLQDGYWQIEGKS